jgi:hypothetical protein
VITFPKKLRGFAVHAIMTVYVEFACIDFSFEKIPTSDVPDLMESLSRVRNSLTPNRVHLLMELAYADRRQPPTLFSLFASYSLPPVLVPWICCLIQLACVKDFRKTVTLFRKWSQRFLNRICDMKSCIMLVSPVVSIA